MLKTVNGFKLAKRELPTAEQVIPRLLDCRVIKRQCSEVLRECKEGE